MPETGSRVAATPRAVEFLERLVREHGPLELFQSGGCCDGSTPICLIAGELPVAPSDVLLGEAGGVPLYIDAELYRRWNEPSFVLDVEPGAPEGFSLGLRDAHLVTRTPRAPAKPV